MDFVNNVTDDIEQWRAGCKMPSSNITVTYSVFFLNLLCIHLATKFLHEFLRRYGQPRIVSEFIIGMTVGNLKLLGPKLEKHVGRVLKLVGQFSIICYMFVLGLEMEPRTILRPPTWESIVAYTGIFSTVVVTFMFYPALISGALSYTVNRDARFVAALALVLSNTSSPILTRLTTDLKIGKSRIGRLVVNAAIVNDMIMTFVVSLGFAILNSPYVYEATKDEAFAQGVVSACWALFVVFTQTSFILIVVPRFAEWINDRNPDGKPMRGFDLAMSLAVVIALTQFSTLISFDPSFNSFLVGLAFPKEGRLSRMLISKINFMITTFGLPFYMCSIGMDAKMSSWGFGQEHVLRENAFKSFLKLSVAIVVGTVGKVSGTVVATMLYGFQHTEGLAIGLLLNIKGYFHILCAYTAMQKNVISGNTFLVFLFDIISTVVFVPLAVKLIVKKARRGLERPLMTVQGLDPSAEVQMVMGILSPDNVPTAISIVEATRGQSTMPLTVYAMDLVQMTDASAVAVVHGQEEDVVAVADEGVVHMREKISLELEKYVQEGGVGLTVVRLLALTSFGGMHEDVCHAAQETASVFIVMPFHRRMRVDGFGMENSHPGFRHVNKKVLHHAPCSVGVLVDRGLGQTTNQSDPTTPKRVAVIFIGGSDDREALALAGRVACHPSFALTAVRFLPESGAETRLARTRGLIVEKTLQEKEMNLDDECFARFFDNHIAGGRVGYLEKYIGSGAEAVVVLKSLEGQYSLFIVGRGGTRNPVLTAGMGDWAECPELGPVGDILSASDFSQTASVLIIQQHDLERDQDVVESDYGFN